LKECSVQNELSKRQRQIVDVVYRLGEATANEIVEALPADLANATVRTQLRILEKMGVIKHRQVGRQFIFRPAVAREKAAKSALHRVLETFFGGSVENALATHLSDPKTKLTNDQLQRLRELIDDHESEK
jgi:BlaI family transcriptional regulator, penicillinase repressor